MLNRQKIMLQVAEYCIHLQENINLYFMFKGNCLLKPSLVQWVEEIIEKVKKKKMFRVFFQYN